MPKAAPKTEFNVSAGVDEISSYPHEMNWKTDPQPSKRTVDEYISDAETLRPVFLEYVENLVKEHAPDAILMVEKSVKEQKSALRKLKDEDIMGDPSRILDYLRAKIVIRASDNPDIAISQINNLRNVLMFDKNVTAYNDRFRRPCPEGGHRAFAAHILVGNDAGVSQKAEIQITHEAFEYGPYDEAVKRLRNAERALAPIFKKDMRDQLSDHFILEATRTYDSMQKARRAANGEAAKTHGLDSLLDADLQHKTDARVLLMDDYKSTRLVGAIRQHIEGAVGLLGEKSGIGGALRRMLE